MAQVSQTVVTLDALDRSILANIEFEGAISCSALARRLKRGRDTIEYRLHRLITDGAILGFHAIIDFYKLGFVLHKCYLRLAADQSKRKVFLNRLRRNPKVFWIAECNGEWDLMFAVVVPSLKTFYEVEGRILSDIADIILESDVFSVVQFSVFQSKSLFRSASGLFTLGEHWSERGLSENEIALLRILTKDARLPLTQVAEMASMSLSSTREKLQRLEQEGLILGYQTSLDYERLGLTHFKTQFFLRDFQLKEEERFRQFCEKHHSVLAYMKQIGTCRTEVEFLASDYSEYASALDEVREKFPKLIRDARTSILRVQQIRWDGLFEQAEAEPR